MVVSYGSTPFSLYIYFFYKNRTSLTSFPIVDSLQAVEIRNRTQKNMRSDISVFDILSAMPLADVAAKIASKSQLVKVTESED